MSVAIGVMTCPARWGMAEQLARRIDGDVAIVYDDGAGCWETARRTWELLATVGGATHALVLQ